MSGEGESSARRVFVTATFPETICQRGAYSLQVHSSHEHVPFVARFSINYHPYEP
jgi:hypothetical protein